MHDCYVFICFKGAAPGAPNTDLDQQRNRVVAASTLKLAQALADRGTLNSNMQNCTSHLPTCLPAETNSILRKTWNKLSI